jgi:hypothetical protein
MPWFLRRARPGQRQPDGRRATPGRHRRSGDISEVLAMSVTEAEEFFGAGEARTPAAHGA